MQPSPAKYIGRFAPSPTGPLHAGSLVAALASWLDARAWSLSTGQTSLWLVRIEDLDTPRCDPAAATEILRQLQSCGLVSDGPVVYQSQRHGAYERALERLIAASWAYPCGCTRKEIAQALNAQGHTHTRHQEWPYPGICRNGLHGKAARAWRLHCERYQAHCLQGKHQAASAGNAHYLPWFDQEGVCHWVDRRKGHQSQNVSEIVGDFVLRRADGLWAYQMAVVVDDALQSVTHITRGEDLCDNTPRQLLLQRMLELPHPHYLHTPLVRTADGEKLSKQHGAPAVSLQDPIAALSQAAVVLGLPARQDTTSADLGAALAYWVRAWQSIYNRLP